MIGDILNDLKSTFDEVRNATATRTITVAKPFCTPARDIVMTALNGYGVKVYDYSERVIPVSLADFARRMKIERKTFENLQYGSMAPVFLPMAIHAEVTVSEKAAAWAEYLLLRTGKLYVPGKYVNRRNEEWAAKHGGRMPPAWQEGKPWIEQSCSEGKQAWRQARAVLKK